MRRIRKPKLTLTKRELIEALKPIGDDEPILLSDYQGIMPIRGIARVRTGLAGYFTRHGQQLHVALLTEQSLDMAQRDQALEEMY